MVSNKKIYYAHHQWKYNTEIEQYEINLIKSKFPQYKIINPNGGINFVNKDEENIMDKCLEEVRNSNILVFSSISGVVGKGVYLEVKEAYRNNIEVYLIFNNELYQGNFSFSIINESNRLYAIHSSKGEKQR